jgi:hypothetical protein
LLGEENVKIGPFNKMLSVFSRVQTKEDKSDSHQNAQFQQKERDKKHTLLVNDEEIQAALEDFSQDATVEAQGLKASVIKSGPFLKVVLKDGRGALVRQFTGEEFIKLREEAKKDTQNRGKILDQKL